MPKINSIEELRSLRETLKKSLNTRKNKTKIIINTNKIAKAAGSKDILTAISEELRKRRIKNVIIVEKGSFGIDTQEPIVAIEKGNEIVLYGNVTSRLAKRIVAEHIVNGQIIKEKVLLHTYKNQYEKVR